MPKRVRWHLRYKPEVISGLLAIFLRAVETTIRQSSTGAPAGARFGAVAFVHRFGSYLNSHVHFHVVVTDGVFSAGDDGEAVFHPAVDLEREDSYRIARLDVFSSALRDDFRPGESDLDLPVEFGPMSPYERAETYFGFLDELRRHLFSSECPHIGQEAHARCRLDSGTDRAQWE